MVADDKSIGIHRPLLRPQLNDCWILCIYVINTFRDCTLYTQSPVIRRVLNSCLSLSLNPEWFFFLFAAPNSLWRMSGWRLCPAISPGIFSGSLSPTVIINLLRPAAVTSASAIFSSSSLWIIRRLLRRSLLAPVSAAVAGTTALLWALWTVRVASCCCPEWAAAAVSCTTPTCTVVFSSFGGIMQAAAVLFCMTARWAWWRDCPPGPEPVSVMSIVSEWQREAPHLALIAFMLPTTPDIFSSACSGNWTTASGFAVVAPRFRIFSTWCCKLGPRNQKHPVRRCLSHDRPTSFHYAAHNSISGNAVHSFVKLSFQKAQFWLHCFCCRSRRLNLPERAPTQQFSAFSFLFPHCFEAR